jgi:hypothetical protein
MRVCFSDHCHAHHTHSVIPPETGKQTSRPQYNAVLSMGGLQDCALRQYAYIVGPLLLTSTLCYGILGDLIQVYCAG